MHRWNVIVTVYQHGYREAQALLREIAPVQQTDYFNVLAMQVDDPQQFLETLRQWGIDDPQVYSYIARALPVSATFSFQTPREFEAHAQQVVSQWVTHIAAQGFHVRMHRRGFKGRLSSQDEERFLDEFLLTALQQRHQAGHISFDDPDVIIAVETLGQWAGLSLWTRAQLQRYPFLHLD